MNEQPSRGSRIKRRQFLANLLFAGGVLTLAGLQSAQAAEHPTDGWTLPDLSQTDPKASPTPPAEPPVRGRYVPAPPKTPEPPTAGVPIPTPPPPGGITPPPPPKGAVVAPPLEGDPAPPKPERK